MSELFYLQRSYQIFMMLFLNKIERKSIKIIKALIDLDIAHDEEKLKKLINHIKNKKTYSDGQKNLNYFLIARFLKEHVQNEDIEFLSTHIKELIY